MARQYPSLALFRTRAVVLSAISLFILIAVVATADPVTYLGPPNNVDAELFGMHVHRAAEGTAWPTISFAEWRLWDAHVTWPQLEPEPGKWHFELLDHYVQLATEHHVEILLTLGLTPTWASARPDELSAYAPGNAAEPRHQPDWGSYVGEVATRYKGRIHTYEIWNEPNDKSTYTGSVLQMVALSRTAYRTLKSVDPSVTVVSPSATANGGLSWLNDFLKQGGCQYADVIGYHFYVTPKAPEEMLALIQQVRATLCRYNCPKPIWNTESGWTKPKRFRTDEEAAGYLMRTYILNWLMGVQRCYWYAWDNHNWSTLDLTSPFDSLPTPVGGAYDVLRRWLLGATLSSCQRNHAGVWICSLNRSGSSQKLIWSDTGEKTFTVPASWTVQSISNWRNQTVPGTNRLTIGDSPLLVSLK